jgi:hypothetical protein
LRLKSGDGSVGSRANPAGEYEFALNGLASTGSVRLPPLARLEVGLGADYGTARKSLQRRLAELVKEGALCTYELSPLDEGKVRATIYTNDQRALERLISGFELLGPPERAEKGEPSYSGLENLLDAAVTASRESVEHWLASLGLTGIEVDRRSVRTVLDSEMRFILYVGYVKPQPSVADRILEELGVRKFERLRQDEEFRKRALEIARELVEEEVLVPYRGRQARGYIAGVKDLFVGNEKIEYAGGSVALHEYWRRKGVRVDENEYPVFLVEVGGAQLSYPPSLLKPPSAAEPESLETRFYITEKLLGAFKSEVERLLRGLGLEGVELGPFKLRRDRVRLTPPFFWREDAKVMRGLVKKAVKLVYRGPSGELIVRPHSPLYAFDHEKLKPYAGAHEVNLTVVYPSTLSADAVNEFVGMLVEKYSELNFGRLAVKDAIEYEYDPLMFVKNKESLEKAVSEAAEKVSKTEDLMLVVLPKKVRAYYTIAKSAASRRGCHTQLVLAPVLQSVLESRKGASDARAALANISAGVYVEHLIQERKALRSLAGPLTWKLGEPADGVGRSAYVGLDVSTAKGVEGAAFVLFDPYGELMGAQLLPLKSETITAEDYEDVLRRVAREAQKRGFERVVVLRDGPPRTPDELSGCLEALERVRQELGCGLSLDYVSVVKKPGIRVFVKKGRAVWNPLQGTHCYLYRRYHLGALAHDVLVVSSKPKPRRTGSGEKIEVSAEPVVLRVYELGRGKVVDEAYALRAAEEYFRLTRLNFWNLETGAHKLALPVKMAHTLAYMAALGIPISA